MADGGGTASHYLVTQDRPQDPSRCCCPLHRGAAGTPAISPEKSLCRYKGVVTVVTGIGTGGTGTGTGTRLYRRSAVIA